MTIFLTIYNIIEDFEDYPHFQTFWCPVQSKPSIPIEFGISGRREFEKNKFAISRKQHDFERHPSVTIETVVIFKHEQIAAKIDETTPFEHVQ